MEGDFVLYLLIGLAVANVLYFVLPRLSPSRRWHETGRFRGQYRTGPDKPDVPAAFRVISVPVVWGFVVLASSVLFWIIIAY